MTEVTIERLGHQGDGIAAGPIFVPGTLPGEVVEGDIVEGRIAAPKIVKPSSERVAPPCRHAKSCGGCSLQHASDPFVEAWKRQVVETALAAQGIAAPIRGIHTSPPQSRRRATLSARRTKKGALVGFHARASDTIIEIPGCQLLQPELIAAIPALEALTVAGGSRKGEISFTVTQSSAGLDVVALGGKPTDVALRAELAQIAGKHGLARLTWEDELIAQRAAPVQSFGNAPVTPPPGAFLQATPDGESTLCSAVLEAVSGQKHVVDLFAGCGTFTLPVATKADVHAVEGEGDMLSALDKGWRHAIGLKTVTTETRDLFRRPLMSDEFRAYDAIIIDPPRAGAEAQSRELVASYVPVVAMVSCNPVTFARDAKILIDGGFALDWIDIVDQFRWSPHVELAVRFSRKVEVKRR
ncbi:class I SAM-dependent RNA methyltransferase [Aliiroseovarius sp. YM-037]|uniref:class I SAM-dependent RNA methyltransferase n=1 Tax=Aliiroseovarius sp. YM-037 TaxID=3341728 RepID=UPI003A80F74C